MLIVCPNCSTSYAIESASLGLAGRTVRCARCKAAWFAAPEVTAAANDRISESEGLESPGVLRPDHAMTRATSDAEPRQEDHEAVQVMAAVTRGDPLPVPAETPVPVAITDAPSLVPAVEPPMSDATAASLFSAIGLPVNLRNLKFENMRISKEAQEGLSSLVIEGTIISITNKPTEVPRLRFSARDAAGQEVYTWTALPGRSILGPGEKLDFRSRFVSPPENAVDVMVRFASVHDTVAGAK